MDIRILTIGIVAVILIAAFFLLKSKKIEVPTGPSGGPPITGMAIENQAMNLIEEELEQAVANMTTEDIEKALLE